MISQISFARLAKAQHSLEKPSKDDEQGKTEEKGKKERAKEKTKPHRRSTKNAPQEISSKRAVTRKREVVEPTITRKRDPRFDTAVNGRYDEHEFRKNYAFLDDYRDAEVKMMKEEIKKTRDESRREELAKKIKSMVPLSA